MSRRRFRSETPRPRAEPVRFLADEDCDGAVVRALTAAGHDVLTARQVSPAADDDVIIARAFQEHRVLITEDADFGRLVFLKGAGNHGVIFTRFPAPARSILVAAVVAAVAQHGSALETAFTVIQPGRVRIRRPPDRAP